MDKELNHIKTALKHCQFPSWALNQWHHRFIQSQQQSNNPPTTPTTTTQQTKTKTRATIVVPYIPNTSEKFKKVCKSKGIQVHFKGTNTLRTALGNPKDKDPKANQTGTIYHYQCPHTNCTSSYIGESGSTLGDRIKEHFKAPSPIHLHSSTTGHPMDPNQFSIVHKEVNSQPQDHQGAYVHTCTGPPLNRNLGMYQLPHIWDHQLQASPTLQHKPANLPTNPTHPTNPLLVPLPSTFCPSHHPLPSTNNIAGDTPILFLYGKYTCLS